MKILFLSAMNEEIEAIINHYDCKKIDKINFQTLYSLKAENNEIHILNTGIGKVNAAITTTQVINKYNYDLIINIGTCGSLDKNLIIGDIVQVSKLAYHDFDITSFGRELGYIPGMEKLSDEKFESEAKSKYIKLNTNLDNELEKIKEFINLNNGQLVTGDQFINDEKSKERIINNFNGVNIVEMESAAIVHSILSYNLNESKNIKIIVLRSVSDDASKKAFISFDEYLKIITKKYINIVGKFL